MAAAIEVLVEYTSADVYRLRTAAMMPIRFDGHWWR